jgi:hypothetical protein
LTRTTNSVRARRHRDLLETLLTAAGVPANVVPDADSAALAIEHRLLPCSTAGDFGWFADLRRQDPPAGNGPRRHVSR